MTEEPKDLGCLNSGDNTERDAIIRRCHELGHKPTSISPGGNRSGLHRVTCHECNYTYTYDTSD